MGGTQAAADQFTWLESNLASNDGHKFIIQDHIYAGARIKHNDKKHTFNLWDSTWNDKLFAMWEANADKIIIELAGHDHW